MPTNSAHILVVDDNPATLYSTSRVLRSAGWTVTEADTGFKALAKVEDAVDLVVLDVNLPDIDGFDVCRRIRENERTARLPVLHLSATFVQDAHKVHGLESGADGYLTHPIEPPVLIATVNAFLRARQAEIELRESESRFRAIFENAPNGVALLSDQLAFVAVNPAFCKLLEQSRDNIVGQAIQQFESDSWQTRVEEIRRQIEQHGSWRGTLALMSSSGRIVATEWSLSTHASPGLWLAIISDITDRIRFEQEREQLLLNEQEARAEAERANRYKDDFIATMSHELRTPLNAILGWSQVIQMGSLKDREIDEAIATIERNARIQADMIADLLDVSRITSGKIRLELGTVDAAAVIDAAAADVLPMASEKSISVNKVVDRPVSLILADPARLKQVVWNLLVNAIKFTPEGGSIDISLREKDAAIEIRVQDNGRGIDSTLLPQVFDRFRQGDASTSRENAGLGLGLAIVNQLVEMHGGKVRAESQGVDQGATFTVRLPIAGARLPCEGQQSIRRACEPPIQAPQQRINLAGVRVLLVEDDPDSRKVLARIVGDCSAEVRAVGSVHDALLNIDAFQPDVMVSDLGMPREDGFELARLVRARGFNSGRLPAIALSAFADSKTRQAALLAGYQANVAKPVEARELTAAIAALVGRIG